MNSKFILIVDKSETYINFKKKEILRNWSSDFQNISKLSKAGNKTLFGEAPVSVLALENINSVKDFAASLDNLSNDQNGLLKKIGQGLLVTTSVSRISTKKAEKLVLECGGKVYSSPSKNITESIISEINFSSNAKKFLLDYLGDDYESAIPIVENLKDFSKEVQKKITSEDLYIRLPKPPGSIPPWSIEKTFWNGNIDSTIKVFRRIIKNNPPLIVFTILKNKILLSYRISCLMNQVSEIDIPSILNIKNNYNYKLSLYRSNNIVNLKLEKMSKLVDEAEFNIKGGSVINSVDIIELLLIKLMLITKG